MLIKDTIRDLLFLVSDKSNFMYDLSYLWLSWQPLVE